MHPLISRTRRHNTKPQCLIPARAATCFLLLLRSHSLPPIHPCPSTLLRFTITIRSPLAFSLPAPSPSLYPTPQTPTHHAGIHGGNFYQGYGGGLLYDGTTIAREQDVVVVALNYRLGALGFLYSGPDKATQFTGNFGLRDQQLALRWVQENAAAFGGDPSRVTIFGQSAGGAR